MYVKDNEWFTMYITVQGKRVIVKLNDKVVLDYTEPENVKRNAGDEQRVLSSGTFALQGHDPNSLTYFRNIMSEAAALKGWTLTILWPLQLRLLNKSITDHVANAHLGVFYPAVVSVINYHHSVCQISQLPFFAAYQGNRVHPTAFCPTPLPSPCWASCRLRPGPSTGRRALHGY